MDTVRVYAYRVLDIARKEKTERFGFDQDAFVSYSS